MKTLTVENLVHRGTVATAGFLFSAELLPESEIRRRVLTLWQIGATIFRFNKWLVLRLAQPVAIDCRVAPGLPLVRYDNVLAAFPVSTADLKAFAAEPEKLVFLDAGIIRRIEIRDLETEKIETWFDVSGFQTIETATLGTIETAPVLPAAIAQVDLRQELKTVIPPADRQMLEILETLRRKKAENLSRTADPILSDQSFASRNSAANSVGDFLAGAFGSIQSLFGDKNFSPESSFAESPKSANIADKARKLFVRALFQMRVAQIFGRKQAKYLAEMMEMFERGDLHEALKHAIPLEDMKALQELTESAPFLGFLRPRDDLRIQTARRKPASSAVHLSEDWFEHLRRTYRQTFERLVAQNKIEEAAFVLAELLKSNQEAVEFLEKHGKLRLAAELAEARDLPAETIVRQWFLAGERARAVRLAVRHNCFEYVVTRLEKENHPQSRILRELWAENLAASGNFAAAVNQIWSLPDKREKVVDWMNRVIEFGGVPAAQMLVKKITLFPESFAEVKAELFDFLRESDLEAQEKRIGFAREAIAQTANPELRILARLVVRQILADWTQNKQRFSQHEFRQLVSATNDFALRTDLPSFPDEPKEKLPDQVFSLEIEARDAGANPIFDARLLPDGKTVIALGEAGVKILSRDNKTAAHFDQPTEKFVVADSGTKAVGLMRRGESFRLTKFDFAARRADYWCDAALSAFAPTFDGNLWFVAVRDAFYAIDTNAADFAAVWNVSDLGASVADVARSKTKAIILVNTSNGFEKWSYDLPSLVLRSRNQVKGWYETANAQQILSDLSASAAYSAAIKQQPVAENNPQFDVEIYDYETRVADFRLAGETLSVGKPQIADDHYVVTSRAEAETTIALYKVPDRQIAVFRLQNPAPDVKKLFGSAKLDERFLTVTDQAGRIIVFDYRETLLRKNFRY